MSAIRKGKSAAEAAKADRALLLELEMLICDLDLTIDILSALCREKLERLGDVVFSESEASRIHFMLAASMRASRDLKAAYYGEPAGGGV